MGYFPAVLALSGGTSGFIRFASYVPLWSPFVMLARLVDRPRRAMGARAVAGAARSITVPLVTLLAIRVYRAGVLLYGQPPTIRTVRPRSRVPRLSGSRRARRRTAAGGTAQAPGRPAARPPSIPPAPADRRLVGRRRRPGLGVAAIDRHSRLRTPGRYGDVRRRASTPAIPWAETASWSARPSPAMAGTTTTSSPGRRISLQRRPPLLERRPEEPHAVEVEDVEHEQRDRPARRAR